MLTLSVKTLGYHKIYMNYSELLQPVTSWSNFMLECKNIWKLQNIQYILCKTLPISKGFLEVINIFLVLIGLVIIFKSQLTDLVESIFTKITKQAGTI